jgi:hypothetical protein
MSGEAPATEVNQQFVRLAGPGEWLGVASELKAAADILSQLSDEGLIVSAVPDQNGTFSQPTKKPSISRPWFLIAGYALENLLKGMHVLLDPSLIADGKLHRTLKTHDLIGLARTLPDFHLTPSEERLLRLATESITYWSRYPIPLSAQAVRREEASGEQLYRAFVRLFARCENAIKSALLQGWAGPHDVTCYSNSYERAPEGRLREWQPNEIPE